MIAAPLRASLAAGLILVGLSGASRGAGAADVRALEAAVRDGTVADSLLTPETVRLVRSRADSAADSLAARSLRALELDLAVATAGKLSRAATDREREIETAARLEVDGFDNPLSWNELQDRMTTERDPELRRSLAVAGAHFQRDLLEPILADRQAALDSAFVDMGYGDYVSFCEEYRHVDLSQLLAGLFELIRGTDLLYQNLLAEEGKALLEGKSVPLRYTDIDVLAGPPGPLPPLKGDIPGPAAGTPAAETLESLRRGLLGDAGWLSARDGGAQAPVEAARTQRHYVFTRLLKLRREAAGLLFVPVLHHGDPSIYSPYVVFERGDLREAWRELSEFATGVSVSPDDAWSYRRELPFLEVADHVRAEARAAVLADTLEAQFGGAWYADARSGAWLTGALEDPAGSGAAPSPDFGVLRRRLEKAFAASEAVMEAHGGR